MILHHGHIPMCLHITSTHFLPDMVLLLRLQLRNITDCLLTLITYLLHLIQSQKLLKTILLQDISQQVTLGGMMLSVSRTLLPQQGLQWLMIPLTVGMHSSTVQTAVGQRLTLTPFSVRQTVLTIQMVLQSLSLQRASP